jgi:RNA polymerase sigma-70 factor, ECF subfamily
MHTRDVHFDANFSLCYEKYSGVVAGSINRIVMNRSIAEDLTQEAYLKIYEKGISIDPAGQTTLAFILKVAKNLSFDYLKKNFRMNTAVKNFAMEEAVIDEKLFSDLDRAVISGEVLSTLHDTLNALPRKERDIFMKRVIHNRQLRDISAETRLSPFLINKIIRGVKLKLRESLNNYFIE